MLLCSDLLLSGVKLWQEKHRKVPVDLGEGFTLRHEPMTAVAPTFSCAEGAVDCAGSPFWFLVNKSVEDVLKLLRMVLIMHMGAT